MFEGRIQPSFSCVFWDKLGQIRQIMILIGAESFKSLPRVTNPKTLTSRPPTCLVSTGAPAFGIKNLNVADSASLTLERP